MNMTTFILFLVIILDVAFIGLISRVFLKNSTSSIGNIILSERVSNVKANINLRYFSHYYSGSGCKVCIDEEYIYFGVTMVSFHFRLPRKSLMTQELSGLIFKQMSLKFNEGSVFIYGKSSLLKEIGGVI